MFSRGFREAFTPDPPDFVQLREEVEHQSDRLVSSAYEEALNSFESFGQISTDSSISSSPRRPHKSSSYRSSSRESTDATSSPSKRSQPSPSRIPRKVVNINDSLPEYYQRRSSSRASRDSLSKTRMDSSEGSPNKPKSDSGFHLPSTGQISGIMSSAIDNMTQQLHLDAENEAGKPAGLTEGISPRSTDSLESPPESESNNDFVKVKAEEVRAEMEAAVEKTESHAETAAGNVKDAAEKAMSGVQQMGHDALYGAKDATETVAEKSESAKDSVLGMFGSAKESLGDAADSLKEKLGGAAEVTKETVAETAASAKDSMAAVKTKLDGSAADTAVHLETESPQQTPLSPGSPQNTVIGMFGSVKDSLGDAAESLKDKFSSSEPETQIEKKVSEVTSQVQNSLSEVSEDAKQTHETVAKDSAEKSESAKDAVFGMLGSVKESLGGAAESLKDTLSGSQQSSGPQVHGLSHDAGDIREGPVNPAEQESAKDKVFGVLGSVRNSLGDAAESFKESFSNDDDKPELSSPTQSKDGNTPANISNESNPTSESPKESAGGLLGSLKESIGDAAESLKDKFTGLGENPELNEQNNSELGKPVNTIDIDPAQEAKKEPENRSGDSADKAEAAKAAVFGMFDTVKDSLGGAAESLKEKLSPDEPSNPSVPSANQSNADFNPYQADSQAAKLTGSEDEPETAKAAMMGMFGAVKDSLGEAAETLKEKLSPETEPDPALKLDQDIASKDPEDITEVASKATNENLESPKDAVMGMIGSVKDSLGDVAGSLKDKMSNPSEEEKPSGGVQELRDDGLGDVKNVSTEKGESTKDTVFGMLGAVKDTLGNAADDIRNKIETIDASYKENAEPTSAPNTDEGSSSGAPKPSETSESTKDSVFDMIGSVKDSLGGVADSLREKFGEAAEATKETVQSAKEKLGENTGEIKKKVATTTESANEPDNIVEEEVFVMKTVVGDTTSAITTSAAASAKNTLEDAAEATKEAAKDAVDAGGDKLGQAEEATKENVQGFGDSAKGMLSGAADSLKEGLGGAADSAKESLSQGRDAIKEAFGGAEETADKALDEAKIEAEEIKKTAAGKFGSAFGGFDGPPKVDITPSDDISAPFGEDLQDFEPQIAASEMAAQDQETLEEFLSKTESSPVSAAASVIAQNDFSPRQDAPASEPQDTNIQNQADELDAMFGRGAPPPYAEISHTDDGLGGYSPEPQTDASAPAQMHKTEPPPVVNPPPFDSAFVDPPMEDPHAPGRPLTPTQGFPRPTAPPIPEKVKEAMGGSNAGGCDLFSSGEGVWDLCSVPRPVLDLIYWRDPKKSGIAFGATFILLVCLHCFSVISVFAYSGLVLLSLTLSFRLYKFVLAKVQKGEEGNPFKPYLEQDLTVPQDKVHKQVDVVMKHGQDFLNQLRRLILIEDVVETAKFGVLLWALTYVGAWFSGMTVLILALIGAFTIPKFYETYKEPIDQYWGVVQGHVAPIMEQIQEKVPFLKKQKTQ